MISVRGMGKVYRRAHGEVAALDHVDVSIPEGSFTCIQGPSGSGKTTLLLALGGMLRPSSGTVEIQGRDIYAMPPSERTRFRADAVGFVFQLFHLVPYLDVLGNLLLGARGSRSAALGDARELLDRLGLADRGAHRPAELSAGERQRVAVGRALIGRPQLVLADEPTGNLDEENARAVFQHLADYHRGGGTVVCVSHGRDTEAWSERVISLRSGRIEEDGS